ARLAARVRRNSASYLTELRYSWHVRFLHPHLGDAGRSARSAAARAVRRAVGGPMFVFLVASLAAGVLSAGSVAAAQAEPSAAEVRQMQDLLDQGYYNSAARLNGPDLVSRYPDSGE